MDRLAQDPVTRCIGRYLIDVPRHMVPQSRWDRLPAEKVGHYRDGVSVFVEPMERGAFDVALQKRHQELQDAKLIGTPELPVLQSATRIGNDVAPAMLFNSAKGTSGRYDRNLEVFGWKEGHLIVATIEGSDFSYPEDRDEPLFKGMIGDVPRKLAELQGVYARVRGRAEAEVPTDPGICIHNGFVSDTGRPAKEKDYVTREIWYSTEVRGLLLTFSSDQIGGGEDTLLDRVRKVEPMEIKDDPLFRTLRKQTRTDAGEPFDEWLAAVRTDARVRGHRFLAEGHSLDSGFRKPYFTMKLFNGKEELQPPDPKDPDQYNMRPPLEKAPLTEAEAVGLWDVVTKTLRLRTGAF
ncbi:T6SS immunity protein Tli4 family protein [Variovorax sp. ZS18.2.2]|uniref:T6SS immunity protein Tli4 family protein n=1 Tax=Variovorax sp. ZS18.2.2 TaxID=2971255 RepID=UPI002150EBD7|nr:T6SS immunity protein Tli4 family protein [Variovorax sp. ZS18.2.2]MCR6480142.1 T6SS immunity protein Tli4 family protein [Variovorax sp. ZS18.2.2]